MNANEKKLTAEQTADTTVRKKEKKKEAANFLKTAIFGGAYALWGYILGGAALPFGATPFGVAFLAASDRRVFFVWAGLFLSALRSSGSQRDKIALVSVYSAVLLLRLLARLIIDPPWSKSEGERAGEKTLGQVYPYAFSEHLALRMSVSTVGAFALGLYRLIGGGLTYYDMYGTVISTVSAPLAVLLFYGYFSKNAKKYRHLFGLLSLSAAILWALGDEKLLGISLGVFGCLFLTLFVTRRYGAIVGALSGAIIGLTVSVKIAPAFAFAALSSGVLFSISPALASLAALSVSLAWGVYAEGLSVLGGTASAVVTSALFYIVADKLFFAEKKKELSVSDEAPPPPPCDIAAERLKSVENSIRELSDGFASTSEKLLEVSKLTMPPSASDARQICDDAFDHSCVSCPSKPVCWGENYRKTSLALNSVCELLRKNGSVSRDALSDTLLLECDRLPDIISQINHNAFVSRRQILESDRTELFALNYASCASILQNILSDEGEFQSDDELWEKLRSALSDSGIDSLSGAVLGKRKRRVLLRAHDRDLLEKNKEEILSVASRVCSFEVGDAVLDDELPLLRIYEKETFSTVYSLRNLRAEGEEKYCGDTSGVFEANGKLYSFISDGMGSGRDAALTSGLCGLFLRKLLSAGLSPLSAIGLLNDFLRNRGGDSLHECSATVDLLELDSHTGNACFFKSGAAPTYIFRDGGLFKLRSGTVPVGILSQLDMKQIDMPLRDGDLVVMVSDGVTDGKEECPWLFDLLRSQGADASPDRISELVVKYAKTEGAKDDISVTAIRICGGGSS